MYLRIRVIETLEDVKIKGDAGAWWDVKATGSLHGVSGAGKT